MKRYSEEFKDELCNRYINGEALNPLCLEYSVDYSTAIKWIEKRDIKPNGTGRFFQPYTEYADYAEIRIRTNGEYVYAKIDLDDIEKCKAVGIWSLTSAGYVNNAASGIYLHRLVMDCPDGLEVDHIHHNLLDNRKSELRIATSSQQNMNQHIRVDNTSGHRGVYYDKARDKWAININIKDHHYRKRFVTYEEACKMADEIYKEEFGEYQYKELSS